MYSILLLHDHKSDRNEIISKVLRFRLFPDRQKNEHNAFPCFYSGADPEFLERGFIYLKVVGFPLLILSKFS